MAAERRHCACVYSLRLVCTVQRRVLYSHRGDLVDEKWKTSKTQTHTTTSTIERHWNLAEWKYFVCAVRNLCRHQIANKTLPYAICSGRWVPLNFPFFFRTTQIWSHVLWFLFVGFFYSFWSCSVQIEEAKDWVILLSPTPFTRNKSIPFGNATEIDMFKIIACRESSVELSWAVCSLALAFSSTVQVH